MGDYISVNEVLTLMSEATQCILKQIPRKKIMFSGIKDNGEFIILCSPQSKLHPQGFYWVDITEEQSRVMNKADKALIVFRLEGRKIVLVQWSELKIYLHEKCMRFNQNEQNHWKLNIYKDKIKISGNESECKIQLLQY